MHLSTIIFQLKQYVLIHTTIISKQSIINSHFSTTKIIKKNKKISKKKMGKYDSFLKNLNIGAKFKKIL
jgi:hypothetical protein